MARILALAERELGAPPTPYCWVVFGSEGRCEQTFATDQDNGLILADDAAERDETRDYFERLAAFAHDALRRCGYPDCPGGFMATNPRWRQPLAVWRERFHGWITDATRRAVEDALVCFDLRPVAGDKSLAKSLQTDIRGWLSDAMFFKSVLAFVSVGQRPPLGFFRTFVVERSGEHRAELDLKLCGSGPIVNAARLLALDCGVQQTNTIDRLHALEAAPGLDATILRDVREAHEYLTLLRLESQLRQTRLGQPLSNYIAPASLTPLQKSLLKDAFQANVRLQSWVESRYKSAIWAQLQSQ
jgi:CBS domain-containing protein